MHHTQQGQLFTQIVLELFKLNGQLIAEGDRLTKGVGLSSARWKILGCSGAFAASDERLSNSKHDGTVSPGRTEIGRCNGERRDSRLSEESIS